MKAEHESFEQRTTYVSYSYTSKLLVSHHRVH